MVWFSFLVLFLLCASVLFLFFVFFYLRRLSHDPTHYSYFKGRETAVVPTCPYGGSGVGSGCFIFHIFVYVLCATILPRDINVSLSRRR